MGFGFATVTPSATSVAQVSAGAVWSYSQRSLTEMQSLVSAIQNNNPSLLSTLSDLIYVPAPYFAGQVSATQVAAFVNNIILNQGMANTVANFVSNNVYGLWTTSFTSQLVTDPYMSAAAVAMLLASQSMSANYAQFILYQLAQNYDYNKWIYTVTASAPSSITFSANATLSTNVLIAQSITIASGVTVTCGTQTCFFVAQNFNNQGTIAAYGARGGGVAGTSEAVGGTAGGGAAIIAVTAALGTINVAGLHGGNLAAGVAYSGDTGFGGIFYILSGMTVPVGGSGAGPYGEPGKSNGGGAGGTGLAGSYGGNATVYSFSSPNAMVTYILQGLSDWWLINVLGKTPSSTTPLAYMYGSGGGGSWTGGGGGGGGGEVVVYGYDIVSGNITASGGVGGSAPYTAGGGGGGGGIVFALYGATSGSVTANVAGGAGQSGGDAGASGTAYIAKVTVNG